MRNNNGHYAKSALDTALNYLSRRQMTEDQLSKKLGQKGFSPEQISEAVKRLAEWRYLDDRSYAAAYCRNRRDRYSKARIRMELKKAGVEEEVIVTVSEDLYSREKEYAICLGLGQKILPVECQKWKKRAVKDNKLRNYPPELYIKKKIGEKLFQKGFPSDIIQDVLEKITQGIDYEITGDKQQ